MFALVPAIYCIYRQQDLQLHNTTKKKEKIEHKSYYEPTKLAPYPALPGLIKDR